MIAELVDLSAVNPKFMVPRPIRLTSRPERPTCPYAISSLMPQAYAGSPRLDAQSHASEQPGRPQTDALLLSPAQEHSSASSAELRFARRMLLLCQLEAANRRVAVDR